MNAISGRQASPNRFIAVMVDLETRGVLRSNAVGNERQADTFERLIREGAAEKEATAAMVGRVDRIHRGFVIWSPEIQAILKQARRTDESIADTAKRCVLAAAK